jgi:hypothetical protein
VLVYSKTTGTTEKRPTDVTYDITSDAKLPSSVVSRKFFPSTDVGSFPDSSLDLASNYQEHSTSVALSTVISYEAMKFTSSSFLDSSHIVLSTTTTTTTAAAGNKQDAFTSHFSQDNIESVSPQSTPLEPNTWSPDAATTWTDVRQNATGIPPFVCEKRRNSNVLLFFFTLLFFFFVRNLQATSHVKRLDMRRPVMTFTVPQIRAVPCNRLQLPQSNF